MHFSIFILSLLLAFGSGTAQYTAASYTNTGSTNGNQPSTSGSTSNGLSTGMRTTANSNTGQQAGSSVGPAMNRDTGTANNGQQSGTSGSNQRSGVSDNSIQGVSTSKNGQISGISDNKQQPGTTSNMNQNGTTSQNGHPSSTSSNNQQSNMASNVNRGGMNNTKYTSSYGSTTHGSNQGSMNHMQQSGKHFQAHHSGQSPPTTNKMIKEKPYGHRCLKSHVKLDNCDKKAGIFFKINDNRWEELHPHQIDVPATIPANTRIIVMICNYGNGADSKAPHKPIIPSLLGDIGEQSVVSVHIYKSANFAVEGNWDFSETPMHLGKKPTLIAPIIHGKVHKSASIFVRIAKSGNIAFVKGKKDMAELHMVGSSLIAGVVDVYEKETCLASVCIDVEIEESANIVTMGKDSKAEIKKATLLGTPVHYKCMDGGSQHVYVNSSANVVHLEKLSMEEESSLLAPTVRSYEIKEGNVFVSIENTANVIVKDKFSMRSSVLAHASITVKGAMKSIVTAFMENSGNLLGKMAHLGGEPNIIGLVDLEKAEKDVKIVATVITSGLMIAMKSIEDATCITNVVQVSKEAKDVEIYVGLVESCDIFSEHATIPENKALLKSLISTGECEKCILKGGMSKSANTLVKKSLFIKSYASLIAKLVDIKEAKEDVEVLFEGEYSCSVHCDGGYSGLDLGKDSHLIGTVLSIKGKGAKAKMLGKQLGNAYVPIKGDGSLVGKGVDTEKAVSSLYIIGNLVGTKFKCPVAHHKY